MENNLQIQNNPSQISVFDNAESFNHAQRMSTALAASTMVPTSYQNNIPNCLVALEMSGRVGMSPLMVMQNMNVIHGKPSWGSSFIIALINSCGRFTDALQFKMSDDKQTCRAWTKRQDGTVIEGPECSMKMASDEGWLNKSGSKWKTMPELMLQYRSAAFFGRLHCPDVLMGMHSQDEVVDAGKTEVMPSSNQAINKINNLVSEEPAENYQHFEVVEPETVENNTSTDDDDF